MDMANFVLNRGGAVKIGTIEAVPNDYKEAAQSLREDNGTREACLGAHTCARRALPKMSMTAPL